MAQQWRFYPQFHMSRVKLLSAARGSSALVLQLLLVLDLGGDGPSLGPQESASIHLGDECHRLVDPRIVFGKAFVAFTTNPPMGFYGWILQRRMVLFLFRIY